VKNIRYEIHNTPRISDHLIVKIKINESRKCTDMKIITRRNYKKYDKEIFQNKLIENYSWNNSISDVEILAGDLLTSITESLDLLCPCEKYIKLLISDQHYQNKWFNFEIQICSYFSTTVQKTRHLCIIIKSQSMSFFDRSKIVVKKFPWMF
jgi:hypothetical protein